MLAGDFNVRFDLTYDLETNRFTEILDTFDQLNT